MKTDEKLLTLNAPRRQAIQAGQYVVTPDLAAEIVEQCCFDGQRKVLGHHVGLLAGIMSRGDWWDCDQITFCRTPDAKLTLVNGYHRMAAVIRSGVSVLFDFRVLNVPDMDAVRRCYASFDTQTRNRTHGEVLSAVGVREEFGLQAKTADAVFRAIPILANRFHTSHYEVDPENSRDIMKRLEMSRGYWATGRTYQDHIKGAAAALKRKLLLSSVVAVGLTTIRHQPQIAEKFWVGLAEQVNLSKGDPRKTIADRLLECKYRAAPAQNVQPQSAKDVAVAWNAFFEGRTVNFIRNAAFRLAGTPWK